MGKPLGALVAEGALKVIGKRIGKSSACSPSVSERPNNKTSKEWRVAPPKNDQYALNGAQGNLIGEIFQQPPRSSGKKEVGEGQGMKNLQENFIGLFLGFVGIGAQGQKQLGKHPVIIGRSPYRRQNGAIGLEVSNVVEGALNFLENAGRNVAQIIVSKSIEGTK